MEWEKVAPSSQPCLNLHTPLQSHILSFHTMNQKIRESSMPYSVESETALPWWLRGKESPANTADTGFNPWVGKSLWRRKWLPTPVFLAGKFHGQRSLVGYAHGIVELDTIRHNLATKNQHSKTDVQRTCELRDITFPPISISLLPVNLKRK